MKNIRAGQPFLYRSNGLNSTVFEVKLKFKTSAIILNSALQVAIERYPYFKTKLEENNGEFTLIENDQPIRAVYSDKLRPLGGKEVNNYLIDITCNNNSVFISFHHALCDGRGVMPFIQTLLYYYISFTTNQEFSPEGIRLVTTPMLNNETGDPMANNLFSIDEDKIPKIEKVGFKIPETETPSNKFYRYEIKVPVEDFVKKAKSINATPAIYAALLASKSLNNLYPEKDKSVICSMASDMRPEMGFENTYKNCVGSIYLPFNNEISVLSDNDKSLKYRELIREQKDPNCVKLSANSQIGLGMKLSQIEGFENKQRALSIFNSLCIDTYVLSYPGRLNIGELKKYVDSMHLYSSGTNGLIINSISAGDYFSFDVLQSYKSDNFINEFISNLKADGLNPLCSCLEVFETPLDNIQETLGLNNKDQVSEKKHTAL